MTADPLRIAVLGCGRMGQVHSEAYAALEDEAAVYFVDADADKARAYNQKYQGAGVLESIEEALASAHIDAIDNCLPDHLHVDVTLAALEAGKHVLLEKPMAHKLEDADRIIHASQQTKRVLMIEENFRFLPHLNRAKEVIASGMLGDVFLIEVNHYEFLQPRGWRVDKRGANMLGGTLIDVGHHFVDMAVQLGGPVRGVFARFSQRTHPHMGGEDTAVLMLEYVSGVTGTLTLSIGTPGAPPKPTFIVCGTAASLYFDWQSGLWTGKGRAWEPAQPVMSKAPEPPDSFAYWGESIHECVRAFVRDVHAGREPAMSGDAGRHDLAIILAAHESARTGQMIPVSVQDTRPILANNRELSFYEQTT